MKKHIALISLFVICLPSYHPRGLRNLKDQQYTGKSVEVSLERTTR